MADSWGTIGATFFSTLRQQSPPPIFRSPYLSTILAYERLGVRCWAGESTVEEFKYLLDYGFGGEFF